MRVGAAKMLDVEPEPCITVLFRGIDADMPPGIAPLNPDSRLGTPSDACPDKFVRFPHAHPDKMARASVPSDLLQFGQELSPVSVELRHWTRPLASKSIRQGFCFA